MRDCPSLPALGEVILGKYAIVRILGKGAMGIVFEAVHVRLGQRVAIKMLRPTQDDFPELLSRFEREARAAARLQNTHVTRVMDVDMLPDGTPFIVMEYLEGHDLAAELRARAPLPIPEAVTWILQACEALGEAHRLGIVHRDIKPSNLFLARSDQRRMIKVLDFGISKMPVGEAEASASATATFSTFGTPLYMSPEQMRSAKYVDGRTDIWALGVVLYQLLSGRLPFQGESVIAIATSVAADTPPPLRALRPDVPEGLERAVATALAKDRDGRFQDAQSFAHAIAPFATAIEVVSVAMTAAPGPSLPALPEQPSLLSASETATIPLTASAWSTAARALRWSTSRRVPLTLSGGALLLAGGIFAMRMLSSAPSSTSVGDASRPESAIAPLPVVEPAAPSGPVVDLTAPVELRDAGVDADAASIQSPASDKPGMPQSTPRLAQPSRPPPTANSTAPCDPLYDLGGCKGPSRAPKANAPAAPPSSTSTTPAPKTKTPTLL